MLNRKAQPNGEGEAPASVLRAALYLRVSIGRQAEQDLSIPDQKKQTKAWCLARGWRVAEAYVEPGASATDDKRPVFQRMIERTCDGENAFDVIVVHSFSRFFRDAFGLEFYVRKLAKHGVKLVSMTQELGEDPAQIMMRQVIALFDEYQSKENAKHVIRAMKENARQGFWNGSRPPLGYQTVEAEVRGQRIKKQLAVNAAEAEVVQLMFRLFLEGENASGSMGIKRLTAWLNDNGYRTRTGRCWGVGQIHHILTNPVYAGRRRFNHMEYRTGRKKPESEHVYSDAPAILEASVWRGLSLLRVLGAGAKGKPGCTGRSIRMDKLDTLVTKHLADRLLEPQRLSEMLEALAARRAEKEMALDDRMASLECEAADADIRLRRLYRLVEEGLSELDEALKERIAALKAAQQVARGALARLKGDGRATVRLGPSIIAEFGARMRQQITSGEIPFRKAYLRAIVDRIEVDHREVRILGRKDVLEQAVITNAAGREEVRSFAPKWLGN